LAKLKMFAAEDRKLGVFLTPFFFLHTGQALRAWSEIVNDRTTVVGKHPADFSLSQIGEFDDADGSIVPHKPTQVATALEYLKAERPQTITPIAAGV